MTKSIETKDTIFFYYALQSIHYLEGIPITRLEEQDIDMLQRISNAAKYDGLVLLLGVDFYDMHLVVDRYLPDVQSKPLLPFYKSPDSEIYISNKADPYQVILNLRELSERYDLLNAPPFQKYEHDDETENHNWSIPIEDFIHENAKAKCQHELFMRDNGMHQTVIPGDYKKRASRLYLVKDN